MSNSRFLKKIKPRPINPKCKCCIALGLRLAKKIAQNKKGHVL